MEYRTGLLFYDLEWTGKEMLQIGAVCMGEIFERTILTKLDIHPKVTASILLQTRLGPGPGHPLQGSGLTRQVYDCLREIFLPSCQLLDALQQFLAWIKAIKAISGQVTLVSHGSVDIPVLYQSFALHNMEAEFLETCTHFVNFQNYLKEHFVGVPVGLPDLVKLFCSDVSYRLHCAGDDARATQDVFFKLHSKKIVWDSNTELVVTDKIKFGPQFAHVKRVRLNFITYDQGGKEMRFLSSKINPQLTPKLVDNMGDWLSILSTLPLFEKVDPPPCHMFEACGWVTRHHLVECDGDEMTKTIVELLCCLGKVYFKVKLYPDSKSTFMKRKLLLNTGFTIPSGTPVTARLQLKAGQEIRVMYIKEGVDREKSLEEVLAKLVDCGDHQVLDAITDGQGVKS
eukprot:GFUD01125078.1.p1 GENE.GFUD01125078.1~~GFUD01125078.1.p1  ORF type:complete len:399 (+),score=100.62 GFUD01125078.1:48-1244(+)